MTIGSRCKHESAAHQKLQRSQQTAFAGVPSHGRLDLLLLCRPLFLGGPQESLAGLPG